MTYFDLSKLKFSLSYYSASVRIQNVKVTTIRHFEPLRKFDVRGKFSASGTTRIGSRKLKINFAPRHV